MDNGISSPVVTTRADSKNPNPPPRKFAVSARVMHRKCSLGANHADARTGGMARQQQFGSDKTN